MNILAFDHVSSSLSICLKKGDAYHEVNEANVRDHNMRILPALENVLSEADVTLDTVDVIVLGRGPGSFTALRISFALVKGLAYAHDIPLVGVSSLRALAEEGMRTHTLAGNTLIVPLIDAKKRSLYASFYRGENALEEEHDLPIDDVIARVRDEESVLLIGDGYLRYNARFNKEVPGALPLADESAHIIRAKNLIALALPRIARNAYDPLLTLAPTYVRMSEAEYNRMKREGTNHA